MQGTEAALRGFTAGDAVLARSYNTNNNTDQKWTEGTIVRKTGPVSYEVQTEDKLCRRHADQLLPHAQPQRSNNSAARESDDVDKQHAPPQRNNDVDAAGERENTRPQRNRRAVVKYGDSVHID